MLSKLRQVFLIAIVLAFSTAAFHRDIVWMSAAALWRDASVKSPQKARPHNNMGNVLRDDMGLPYDAIKEYKAAMDIAPYEIPPRHNITVAYLMLNRYDEAEKELLAAVRLGPDIPVIHGNLGFIYLKKGLWDKAKMEFETALTLKPDYRMASDNLMRLKEIRAAAEGAGR